MLSPLKYWSVKSIPPKTVTNTVEMIMTKQRIMTKGDYLLFFDMNLFSHKLPSTTMIMQKKPIQRA